MNAEAIGALIPVIFEAAIDNQAWQRIVDSLAAGNAGLCVAFMVRPDKPTPDICLHAGFPPGAMEDFIARHAELCPWNDIRRDSRPGAPYATEDVMPLASITYSKFYRDWLVPLGLGGGFGLTLCDYPDCHASFLICCPREQAIRDRATILDMLSRLAPLFQRSIEISRSLGTAREDGWRAGILRARDATAIIDGSATVLNTNAAMDQIVSAGLCALPASRKLRLYKPDDTARLSAILVEAVKGRRTAAWPHVMAFEVPGRNGPNVLEVEPLEHPGAGRPQPSRGLFDGTTGAMLFVMTMRVRCLLRGPSVEHIRSGLGLTPKQAEAVWSLVNGENIEKQAHDRGLSVDGVRWHFKNIYQRTGCSTQAELVRLVISLFGPART